MKFNCYDCGHSSDKCKNRESKNYNKFNQDITRCDVHGLDLNNQIGISNELYERILNGENVE